MKDKYGDDFEAEDGESESEESDDGAVSLFIIHHVLNRMYPTLALH